MVSKLKKRYTPRQTDVQRALSLMAREVYRRETSPRIVRRYGWIIATQERKGGAR